MALVPGAPAGADTVAATTDAWHWQDVDRVVVVPDVHGAYDQLVDLLRDTGLVDDSLTWTGERTHLVSLGDLLDRGPDSRDVMDLLMRLQEEAPAAGGRVHVVLGNHEHMNLVGDLRYVSAGEFAAFADEETDELRESARREFAIANPELGVAEREAAFADRYPPGYFAHRAAFRPDGRYGRWLLNLPVVIVINDTAFVHGGLPAETSDWTLAELNRRFSEDLGRYLEVWGELVAAGALPGEEPQSADALVSDALLADPSRCIEQRALACESIEGNDEVIALIAEFDRLSEAPVNGYDSPFWYRGSVYCRDLLEVPVLERYLATIGAGRVVVGHTPTTDRQVRAIRDGRVIMTDTGMLASYYRGKPAALVIEDGELTVRYLGMAEPRLPAPGFGPVAHGLATEEFEAMLRDSEVAVVGRDTGAGDWQVELAVDGRSVPGRFYPAGRGGEEELAADALDGLLGTELVPATVRRRVDGTDGALQFVWPREITEAERAASGTGFGGWCPMSGQFQLMYAFDLLIAERRSTDRIVYSRDDWTLQLTGHADAFGRKARLPRGIREGTVTLAPGLRRSLAGLSEEDLRDALGDLLDDRRRRAILSRRDELLQRFGD